MNKPTEKAQENQIDLNPGYAPVPRGIRDHPDWPKKPFTKGQALTDLFLSVTFDKQRIGGVLLVRGQALVKKKKLAKRWGWSREKVYRFFRSLEKDKGELWAIEQEIIKPSVTNPMKKPRTIGTRITFIYYDQVCGNNKK